jgi:hypothetical protein
LSDLPVLRCLGPVIQDLEVECLEIDSDFGSSFAANIPATVPPGHLLLVEWGVAYNDNLGGRGTEPNVSIEVFGEDPRRRAGRTSGPGDDVGDDRLVECRGARAGCKDSNRRAAEEARRTEVARLACDDDERAGALLAPASTRLPAPCPTRAVPGVTKVVGTLEAKIEREG